MLTRLTTSALLASLLLLFMTSLPDYSKQNEAVAARVDSCVDLIQSCPLGCEESKSCRNEVVKRWTAKCEANPNAKPEAQDAIYSECTACNKRCNWLDGVWEGKAYQSEPKTSWTMILTAEGDSYSVEYPSLSCGGRWYLVSKESNRARFTEKIEYGLEDCANDGKVLIERIDPYQVSFRYSYANSDEVVASATLRKR